MKKKLLHLVGCLHRCTNDVRPQKHQASYFSPSVTHHNASVFVDSNNFVSVTNQSNTHVYMGLFFFLSQCPVVSPHKILNFFPESRCVFAGLSLQHQEQQKQMAERLNLVAVRKSVRPSPVFSM